MPLVFDYQEVNLAPSQSMAADFQSGALEVFAFDGGSIHVIWTGSNNPTLSKGKLVPQASINGTDWCDLVASAASKTVNAVNGCQMYEFTSFGYRFLRLKFVAGSNNAGTCDVLCFVKRQRISA